jgi:hypothetical protein
MALMDAKLFFGDLNLASGNSTLASGLIGDVIDLGAAGKDGWGNTLSEGPGEGQSMFMNVNVNTVIGGAAGWVKLCQDGALSSGNLSSANEMFKIDLASALAVGQHISVSLPAGMTYDRYLQISGGASSTTGKVDVWISDSPTDSEIGLK